MFVSLGYFWLIQQTWDRGIQIEATCTHTHPFNGPFSGTTQVSRYQKSKTNLDFTETRDNEWQWLQLGHVLVCTSLQRDNHANTPPLSFLQAGCPSCRPTNSVKVLKAIEPTSLRRNWCSHCVFIWCWKLVSNVIMQIIKNNLRISVGL